MPDKTPLLLCIGHASWDQIAHLDQFPSEDSKTEIPSLIECGGGPAATAACLAAKWGGVRVMFAGTIGADRVGRSCQEEFSKYGVDSSLTSSPPGTATPLSFIIVNQRTGSRTIINRKSPAPPLTIDWLSALPEPPDFILCDGHEPEASLAALKAFPDALSILDAGSRRAGTAQLAHKMKVLASSKRFAFGDAFTPPEDEQALYDAFTGFCAEFPEPDIILTTLGAHGVISKHRRAAGAQHWPAPFVRAIDTTGAGDIWHGALAWALARGQPFDQAIPLANRAAAWSVTIPGSRISMPAGPPGAGDLNIRRASITDASTLSRVLTEVAAWIALHTERPLWPEHLLTQDALMPAIESGQYHLVERHGIPVAAFRFQREDPEFWPDKPEGEACYIHRVAVRRFESGGSVVKEILVWAARETLRFGREWFRLDTDATRPALISAWQNAGMHPHSEIVVEPWGRALRFESRAADLAR